MARTKAAKAAAVEAEAPTVVSIKGFDSELKCRDFQFEIGKTYTVEGAVVACQNGFHAIDAETPFHVWDFYPVIGENGQLNRYAEVVQSGAMERQDDDSKRGTKVASASIEIRVELSLPDFIKRAVTAIIAATKGKDESGYSAKIGSSGDYAKIGSSGDSAQISATGKDAVVASAGPDTVVTAAEGAWISVAEFVDGKCVGFATGCIGKDGLLPNMPYRAKGGKLVAA